MDHVTITAPIGGERFGIRRSRIRRGFDRIGQQGVGDDPENGQVRPPLHTWPGNDCCSSLGATVAR